MSNSEFTFTSEQLTAIAHNTDNNDHGHNYYWVATLLDLPILAENFKCINTLHNNMGYLNDHLSAFRHSMYQSLMSYAATHCTNYKELYTAL